MIYSVGSHLESCFSLFWVLERVVNLTSFRAHETQRMGPHRCSLPSLLAHTKTAEMSHVQESSSVSMNSSDVNANATADIIVMPVVFILVIITTTTIIYVARGEPAFHRGHSLSVAVVLPPSCRVSAHTGCANLPPAEPSVPPPCQP